MPDPVLVVLAAALALAAALLAARGALRRARPPLTEFERLIGGKVTPPPARPTAPGPCAWSRDAFRPAAADHRWVCTRCGAEGFTRASQPPAACLRADRRLLHA